MKPSWSEYVYRKWKHSSARQDVTTKGSCKNVEDSGRVKMRFQMILRETVEYNREMKVEAQELTSRTVLARRLKERKEEKEQTGEVCLRVKERAKEWTMRRQKIRALLNQHYSGSFLWAVAPDKSGSFRIGSEARVNVQGQRLLTVGIESESETQTDGHWGSSHLFTP